RGEDQGHPRHRRREGRARLGAAVDGGDDVPRRESHARDVSRGSSAAWRCESSHPVPNAIVEPRSEYHGHAIALPSGNGIHPFEPSHRTNMKTDDAPIPAIASVWVAFLAQSARRGATKSRESAEARELRADDS